MDASASVVKFFGVALEFVDEVVLREVLRFAGGSVCIFADPKMPDRELVISERTMPIHELMARRVAPHRPERFDASSVAIEVEGYVWTDGAVWWISAFVPAPDGAHVEVSVSCPTFPTDPVVVLRSIATIGTRGGGS